MGDETCVVASRTQGAETPGVRGTTCKETRGARTNHDLYYHHHYHPLQGLLHGRHRMQQLATAEETDQEEPGIIPQGNKTAME